MSVWALIATAVALAMDAFAVALASGVRLPRAGARRTFRLAWHFGLFQAVMPIAGWSLGRTVYSLVERVDHWVAFALLAFVGVRMVIESFRSRKEDELPDPTKGAALVMLSIAVSIDALAVGFSLSLLKVSIWGPAVVIGIVAGVFTAVGLQLGRFLGGTRRLQRYPELAGGLVLIGIGLDILRGHGVF